MPQSVSYLFKNSSEFIPESEAKNLPGLIRGLYVLYKKGSGREMNVVYVGMARGDKTGVKGRLLKHKTSKTSLWTHFSVYEVWDNITRQQIEELEGLFRHLYRRDSSANILNKQKGHGPLHALAKQTRAATKSAA